MKNPAVYIGRTTSSLRRLPGKPTREFSDYRIMLDNKELSEFKKVVSV